MFSFLQTSNGEKKKRSYDFAEVLGQGAFGVVKRAHLKSQANGVDVAVKKVKRKLVAPDKRTAEIRKAAIEHLRSLDHPHVVNLLDWFETRSHFYVVYEYYPGHELFDRIIENGKLHEADSRLATIALISAIKYLHDQQIIHRDIKPENILMKSDHGPADDLVLADFGLATRAPDPPELLYAVCGSPGYAAPEVYQRTGYHKPADMWSTGVVIYAMLSGRSPFKSSETPELIQECKEGKVAFPDRYWRSVSPEALDFVKGLLTVDQTKRLTADGALAHKWLTNPPASALPELSKSGSSASSLPNITRNGEGSEVRRQPTLREPSEEPSPTSSTSDMADPAKALPGDDAAAKHLLSSCPSWRFMPSCKSRPNPQGIKDVRVDKLDEEADTPSLASLESSDNESTSPSEPASRRSSLKDEHAQKAADQKTLNERLSKLAVDDETLHAH